MKRAVTLVFVKYVHYTDFSRNNAFKILAFTFSTKDKSCL